MGGEDGAVAVVRTSAWRWVGEVWEAVNDEFGCFHLRGGGGGGGKAESFWLSRWAVIEDVLLLFDLGVGS